MCETRRRKRRKNLNTLLVSLVCEGEGVGPAILLVMGPLSVLLVGEIDEWELLVGHRGHWGRYGGRMPSDEGGRGVGRAGWMGKARTLLCRLVSSSISLSFCNSMPFPMFQLHNSCIFVPVA